MNIKRLLLAILAAFAAIFLTDMLIHGFWLMADYDRTKEVWRPEAQMNARIGWMFFAQFLCAATFTLVWARGYFGQGMANAITFGLLMGVFQQIWAIIDFVVLPVPGGIAVKWFIAGVVQAIIVAIVVAAIYKPRPVADRVG